MSTVWRWRADIDASSARNEFSRWHFGHDNASMLMPLKLVRDQQLQQQIFDQLRDLIVTSRLQPGSRLPSSRMMVEQFEISRMTVLLTYERLIADGYLETRPSAGTFVARPFPAPAPMGVAEPLTPYECPGPAVAEPEARVGRADPSLFPTQRWRSLMRAGLDRMGTHLAAEHPAGSPALRRAIACWLSSSRGLAVAADQVILLKSRQQALHLAAHLASRSSSRSSGGTETRIVVEDPCDDLASATLAGEGSVLVRVPVDVDGMRIDCLPAGDAALIHVTPEHQRPLGVGLSHDRRVALLAWAAASGTLILEEDCDGELRYGATNVPSLMRLDTADRVILLGGFCVSLGPWLDMAYLVLPHGLIASALTERRLIDDSRGTLEQTALAEFLEGGGYARHLHRLTKAYASRRDALLAALRRHLGDPARVWGQHAGLHLAWFPSPETGSPDSLAALARLCGLDAAAVPARQAVLLGFGAIPERQIETGVRQLATLTQKVRNAEAHDRGRA
jgi:GntR family transcriptional regulator/MocR family aminotransferase